MFSCGNIYFLCLLRSGTGLRFVVLLAAACHFRPRAQGGLCQVLLVCSGLVWEPGQCLLLTLRNLTATPDFLFYLAKYDLAAWWLGPVFSPLSFSFRLV